MDLKTVPVPAGTLIELSGRLDAVLHFASPASPIDYLKFPIPTLKVGALGTHNALGVAKTKKATFLLASTSEVYGKQNHAPLKETDYCVYGSSNKSRWSYAASKLIDEFLALAYYRESVKRRTKFRPGT